MTEVKITKSKELIGEGKPQILAQKNSQNMNSVGMSHRELRMA